MTREEFLATLATLHSYANLSDSDQRPADYSLNPDACSSVCVPLEQVARVVAGAGYQYWLDTLSA